MTLYATELQKWGLKKESSRLTVEATPSDYFPVDPGSEMKISQKLLPDHLIRGVKARYPQLAGPIEVAGKIKMPLKARNIGEFLVMLFGATPGAPTTLGSGAYKHSFTQSAGITPTTYTIFVDRGVTAQAYNGACVKKMMLTGPVANYVEAEMDMLALTEASTSALTASYTETDPIEFYQTSVKVGGATDTNIKDWKLDMDAMTFLRRTQNQLQTPIDINQAAAAKITGSFNIFFASETERAKYVAATSNSLEFLMVGALIGGGFFNTVDITLPKVQYTAYPYADIEGLFGAAVSFEAVYDTSTSTLYKCDLTNTKSAAY